MQHMAGWFAACGIGLLVTSLACLPACLPAIGPAVCDLIIQRLQEQSVVMLAQVGWAAGGQAGVA